MLDSLFFIASKIIWAVISPGSLILILFAVGLLLRAMHKPRAAKSTLLLTFTLYGLIAFFPVGKWLIAPLETRFTTNPELPESVDGIILLAGSINAIDSYIWDQVEVNSAADRNLAFVILARNQPDARLVFTGGSGALLDQEFKEADIAQFLFSALGIEDGRIQFEGRSRNTYENAQYSKTMAQPAPGETWVLVTSAFHMPRSVGVFCAQGWPVIPYPVDHRSSPGRNLRIVFDFSNNLELLTTAIREWVGLAAYYLTGKTSDWLPGPCPDNP